jgi:methylenetetrahydrofolate reductase (NADPH)
MNPEPPSAEALRARLRDLLEAPRYELIPLSGVADAVAHLPAGASVTVTASPAKGTGATMDLAALLAAEDFDVIPHLAARQIADRSELEAVMARARTAAITEAFVVGGDATDHGEFVDGGALLQAMEEIGHPFDRIGVAGYPEGHAFIPDQTLQAALDAKTRLATSVTTQMCFDDGAIRSWLEAERGRGMRLPVYLGIPGVAAIRRLLRIATRIGVGDSARFLSSNTGLLGRLVRPGGYAPDGLLLALVDVCGDPSADVAGFHIFTFNQVQTTERWRRTFLDELR